MTVYIIYIKVIVEGERCITLNTKAFSSISAGQPFNVTMHGIKDGESFCSAWYENRTSLRSEGIMN